MKQNNGFPIATGDIVNLTMLRVYVMLSQIITIADYSIGSKLGKPQGVFQGALRYVPSSCFSNIWRYSI